MTGLDIPTPLAECSEPHEPRLQADTVARLAGEMSRVEGGQVAPTDRVSVISFTESDWAEIQHQLELLRRDWFVVDLRTAPVKQGTRLAAVVSAGDVVALALVRSRGRSGALHTQIFASRLELLKPPIPANAILELLSPPVRSGARDALAAGGILTERASIDLHGALEQLDADAAAAFTRLREIQRTPRRSNSGIAELLNEQRDALALGLEAAGIDSGRLVPDVAAEPEPIPFLTGLAFSSTSEASVIRHDMAHFGDWELTDGRVHDVVQFIDPEDPRRRVSVLYADKEDLERVTGTDLIYYREDNPSFVLVQYKRMRRASRSKPGEEWGYRPDPQLFTEIERMRKIDRSGQATDVDGWRLSAEPFYFKLIEDSKLRPEHNRLVRGMYFPLDLFELVLKDPRIRGEKDGRRIGWHNARRYLTNTEFLLLLQKSIIGSTGVTTTQLSDLINQVLAGGRGAVVVRDETPPSVDRRRHAQRSTAGN